MRIFKLFHVRDETARLNCEAKSSRRSLAPQVDGVFTRQLVERVIYFDSVEVLTVKGEHFGGSHLRRIEVPHPMFVVPAGRSDMYSCGHNWNPQGVSNRGGEFLYQGILFLWGMSRTEHSGKSGASLAVILCNLMTGVTTCMFEKSAFIICIEFRRGNASLDESRTVGGCSRTSGTDFDRYQTRRAHGK